MRITLVLLLTVLNHVAFTGGRMTVALDAISLRASTFTVGLLMSLYAVLPMSAVRWARALPCRADGRHEFPELEP